jgi:hypothetical protein
VPCDGLDIPREYVSSSLLDHKANCPDFYSLTRIAGWINVGGLALCVFMLLSFMFLPVEKTKRQYLNVCLIIGIVMMEVGNPIDQASPTLTSQLGFIIPLGARPDQCHNEITPNDMYSSMTCAWSGALIIAGGVAVNMWSE